MSTEKDDLCLAIDCDCDEADDTPTGRYLCTECAWIGDDPIERDDLELQDDMHDRGPKWEPVIVSSCPECNAPVEDTEK